MGCECNRNHDQGITVPTSKTIKMRLVKVTPGAIQYGQLDAKGNLITDYKQGDLGAIYVRKTTFDSMQIAPPQELTITITPTV